jgi:hypothetical protein
MQALEVLVVPGQLEASQQPAEAHLVAQPAVVPPLDSRALRKQSPDAALRRPQAALLSLEDGPPPAPPAASPQSPEAAAAARSQSAAPGAAAASRRGAAEALA